MFLFVSGNIDSNIRHYSCKYIQKIEVSGVEFVVCRIQTVFCPFSDGNHTASGLLCVYSKNVKGLYKDKNIFTYVHDKGIFKRMQIVFYWIKRDDLFQSTNSRGKNSIKHKEFQISSYKIIKFYSHKIFSEQWRYISSCCVLLKTHVI